MLQSIAGTVFFLGVMLISMGARAADPYEPFSVLLQKKIAPDVALPAVGGKTVGLSDYKGKVVLLGFFKTF